MDNVKLLNRTDKKYLLPLNKLDIFLEQIKHAYRVLEINGARINSYQSFYYDTPDFDLYNAHHNKILNRLKIRFRSYIQSKIHFLEIKLKTNKGRTIKKRINVATPNILSETEDEFIRQYYNLNKPLINTINIEYQRITLVNKQLTERITVDINLLFKTNEESKILNNIAIIEIKQDDYKKLSQAELILKNMRIKEGFMSKYCLGMALLKPVKQNLFKSKIRNIIKTNTYA